MNKCVFLPTCAHVRGREGRERTSANQNSLAVEIPSGCLSMSPGTSKTTTANKQQIERGGGELESEREGKKTGQKRTQQE